MKNLLILSLLFLLLIGCKTESQLLSNSDSTALPKYDHIVIVVEENKDYDQVIGSNLAPYINDILCKEGANMTQMFAEEHPSEGNYFWMISGNNHNVGFSDNIPDRKNNSQYPFTSKNLIQQLIEKGYSFKGYSESLPHIGDTVNTAGLYARKHVPWVSFGNIPNGNTEETSVNLQFDQFPSDYNKLPTVSFVIPNLVNDMHNGIYLASIPAGDNWLKENIDGYYQWAKTHNSLLIVTFDENDDKSLYRGLTDPASSESDKINRIPTIFAGAHIKQGNFTEVKGITHVNILRTIEAMYGLDKSGTQQPNALRYGISDDYIIKDIFK